MGDDDLQSWPFEQVKLEIGEHAGRAQNDPHMTERFSLSVKSRVERLAEIADFIDRAGRASGLADTELYDIEMAVDEACTNVIQHAYHGRKNGTIDITCERRGKDFVIVIEDRGDPFDPTQVVPPQTHAPLSRRRVGGLGLFFMHKLMDRVDFQFSSEKGNRLTMVKRIKR